MTDERAAAEKRIADLRRERDNARADADACATELSVRTTSANEAIAQVETLLESRAEAEARLVALADALIPHHAHTPKLRFVGSCWVCAAVFDVQSLAVAYTERIRAETREEVQRELGEYEYALATYRDRLHEPLDSVAKKALLRAIERVDHRRGYGQCK